VRLVLSFLCIVLAYDGISGESERGTLRLLLANPISRLRVLLAKYLACLAVLVAAFLLGSVCSVLILSLTGATELSIGLGGRYLLYLLGTVLYLTVFLLLALGVSALSRSSASALVMLTLGWAVFIVVLPSSSYLIAVRSVDYPTNWQGPGRYWRDARQAALGQDLFRGRERGARDGFASEQRGARILTEADKEVHRIGQAFLDLKLNRYLVAYRINLLSPAYAFQYTVEALLGSGLAKRQSFLEQAFAYRDELRAFLRDRDAADGDSPHILYFDDYMSRQPLDGEHIPRFVERRLSPAEGLAFSMTPFLILVLEAFAAFVFALWAIRRTDLTGYAMAEEA
jgi:ABC-type transport system involved in multi-copper enzyme maturation permease subunit